MIQYYPVIDGLRAIAVVSVIIYHFDFHLAGSKILSSGFLGVDIFFLISGFLISSIIINKLEANNFSFKRFYYRRARRILPALIFTLILSSICAWFIMTPNDLAKFAETLLSTIFISSNYYFLSEDSYTAIASSFKPLLHTWSLSLEEQFYLIYPLILLASWRYCKKYFNYIFAGLTLASIVSMKFSGEELAFYSLHCRAWEFCLGTIIAYTKLKSKVKYHQSLSWTGILLISISLIGFKSELSQLSLASIISITGTALIILAADQKNLINSFLSSRPMVRIGLISYSLYLIHQPAIVFLRLNQIQEPNIMTKILVIASLLVLANLSWQWIEQPYRKENFISNNFFIVHLITGILIILSFAGYVIMSQGAPHRMPAILQNMEFEEKEIWIDFEQNGICCHSRRVKHMCRFNEGGDQNYILLGDSHIATLSPAFLEETSRRNNSLTIMTSNTCHYAPNLAFIRQGKLTTCRLGHNKNRRDYLLNQEPSTIVMGGRLIATLSNEGYEDSDYQIIKPGFKGSKQQHREVILETIKEAIEELLEHGHKVVLVYPVPELHWKLPRRFKKLLEENSQNPKAWLESGGITIDYQEFRKRQEPVYQIYDSVSEHPNLLRVYPEDIFCNQGQAGRCKTHDNESLYYVDDDHLSTRGAKLLVNKIFEEIAQKWR